MVVIVVVDIMVLICASQSAGNEVSMERPHRFGVGPSLFRPTPPP